MTTTAPVVIVGAGPVGMMNALGLARAGVPVIVLERHPHIIPEPRAMTYHWSTLDHLERWGLLEDMLAEGFRLREFCYRIFATDEVIRLPLSALDGHVRHPYSLVLGQDQLEQVVLNHLAEYPHAEIHWNTTVQEVRPDEAGVTVIAERDGVEIEYRGDWLIAGDGGRSVVRSQLGIPFEGVTWPERFVATNVRCDLEAYGWDVCNYLVDPKYGAVIAKVTRSGIWRVTFSEPADLPDEGLEERIRAYYAAVLPPEMDYELLLHAAYNMHQRWADSFRYGRVLLAGDAAHITNPTNGFGLVSGILDSIVLAEALGAVVNGEAGEEVLDRYAEDRRRVFAEVASPSSVETKRLVFHSTDPERFEADLEVLRRKAADPELARMHFQLGAGLVTESVVPVG